MTTDTRTAALTATIDRLSWCTTIPHTIDQVVGIHIEATSRAGRPLAQRWLSNDELLGRITGNTGGGKGGHSDPTAVAALMGEPDAVDDADETLGMITHTCQSVADYADQADRIVSDALGLDRWNPPPTGGTRTQLLAHTEARIHHARPNLEPAIDALGHNAGHLDWLIRSAIHDEVEWLHEKARDIWATSKGDTWTPVIQKKLTYCACCTSWGLTELVAEGSDLCPWCHAFRSDHKFWPTKEIHHQLVTLGRKRLSRSLLDDAEAASKKRVG